MRGYRQSLAFPMKWTGRRPHLVATMNPSMSAFGWFPAKITAPSAGTYSRPTTSMRRKNVCTTRLTNHTSIR